MLLEVECGPQSRVAAADDGDVAGQIGGRREQRLRVSFGSQRLAEPWASPALSGTKREVIGGEGRGGHPVAIIVAADDTGSPRSRRALDNCYLAIYRDAARHSAHI